MSSHGACVFICKKVIIALTYFSGLLRNLIKSHAPLPWYSWFLHWSDVICHYFPLNRLSCFLTSLIHTLKCFCSLSSFPSAFTPPTSPFSSLPKCSCKNPLPHPLLCSHPALLIRLLSRAATKWNSLSWSSQFCPYWLPASSSHWSLSTPNNSSVDVFVHCTIRW